MALVSSFNYSLSLSLSLSNYWSCSLLTTTSTLYYIHPPSYAYSSYILLILKQSFHRYYLLSLASTPRTDE